MKETDFVNGFAKGLRVIEAFGEGDRRLSIADVAKKTGLDRATVRRSLLTLAELQYADYDGKFFTLTPRILRLGHAYLSATPLPALLQPHLDLLAEKTGQSSSASVLDGTQVLYIARASQRRVMSINLNPGSRLPAYCSSMGRILLAALGDDGARDVLARTDLHANTDRTLTDIDAIIAELGRVRQLGYAIIDQELELGLRSIAVPLKNRRGETIAALNVGAPAAHMSLTQLVEHVLPLLRQAAENISLSLG
ncbi:IclR family transcriptional regulator [Neorhizobium sp. JUb45]|uniref:IclR family transcriptional regulator n=1 Tax=unclassified Neorhizobium TaxID=2629175 RepID=UPI0010447C6F|nr:IclR family transcriptional regulator [Neorhizobium sp. JUb45]